MQIGVDVNRGAKQFDVNWIEAAVRSKVTNPSFGIKFTVANVILYYANSFIELFTLLFDIVTIFVGDALIKK